MPHSNIEGSVRQRARALRKGPTGGEQEMWAYLKTFRPLGARFRRQAPIGPIVVDFAWLSAKLVIEVDGGSHELPGRAEHDRARDAYLNSQGFEVLRVRGSDVAGNIGEAFSRIENAVLPHLQVPLADSGPGSETPPPTSPHKGEGSRALPWVTNPP